MKPLLLALLLLSPAQDDKAAEKLYHEMFNKLATAKTLQVEFSVTVGRGGRSMGLFSGTMRMKGADRFTMDLAVREEMREQRDSRVAFLSDGRKVLSMDPRQGIRENPPKVQDLSRMMLDGCRIVLLPLAVLAEPRIGGDGGRMVSKLGEGFKSGGKDKVGGRDALIVEYPVQFGGGPLEKGTFMTRLWIDAETKVPLQRRTDLEGTDWTETYKVFAVDGEIPDAVFKFQSLPRLARARALQLAESARLYGAYTGRNLKNLEDLLTRPAGLEPEIFWPPGGFVLGGALPKDPWGRPYELQVTPESARLVSLGADGKAGGTEDNADVPVDLEASERRPIGAVSERLNQQYGARVQLRLLRAMIEAYRESYGELPAGLAGLTTKGDWVEVWPEGGWLPGGELPADPWGDRYVLASSPMLARLQVKNPKIRSLASKGLLPEEKRALEAVARPRFSDEDRKELDGIFSDATDDDLETRDKARARLARWGSCVRPLILERLAREKDPDAKSWLNRLRGEGLEMLPPFMTELAILSITVGSMGSGETFSNANERNAMTSLKTLCSAEADFRANDRDGNRVNDFWVADVAGLYSIKDPTGQAIHLIELSIAAADAAPLKEGAAGGRYAALPAGVTAAPKAGYSFRAMTTDNSTVPPEVYATNTKGTPDLGAVHNTSRFGFSAYPAEYGITGTRTYIINENNTMFWSDTQGEAVLEWPSDAVLLAEWHKGS